MQTAVLTSISQQVVADFTAGVIDADRLLALFIEADQVFFSNTFEIIETLLCGNDDDSPYSIVTSEGEILAGPDGEALIPEWIEFSNANGCTYAVCEPVVYKLPHEVKMAYELISDIGPDVFREKFNKEVLAGAKAVAEQGKAPQKDSDSLLTLSWDDFEQMKLLYQKAAHKGNCIALLYLYDM